RQLWRTTGPTSYATLFVGILDPGSGHLVYVNAGHNAPLLLRADGSLETGVSTGLPVALIDDGDWRTASLDLGPGDLLTLYTDGIPETWRDEEHDYGEERFQALLTSLCGKGVDEVRDAALADVRAFRGEAPVSDDVTLLLLKRLD
ncbi:serine/threonine-protein phosphatase, partial [bacterium]|nr:serine/threonine-protein phosphatase [bacterium]